MAHNEPESITRSEKMVPPCGKSCPKRTAECKRTCEAWARYEAWKKTDYERRIQRGELVSEIWALESKRYRRGKRG